jgi:predicted nucleic acid-binding protein
VNPVFLDTVGLLAIWDESDQWHVAAESVFQQLFTEKRPVRTSPQVLFECGNASARRPYRSRVNALRQLLQKDNLILEPTAEDLERAWLAFDRGECGQAGIVDHISFVLMRRAGLTEAFTNDRHFLAAGFTNLF